MTTARYCQGETMTLPKDPVCLGTNRLQISKANYGRTHSNLCPGANSHITNCIAENSLEVVRGRCQGQRSCSVPVSNSVFGDPCPGTYKYLEVEYICGQPTTTSTTTTVKTTTPPSTTQEISTKFDSTLPISNVTQPVGTSISYQEDTTNSSNGEQVTTSPITDSNTVTMESITTDVTEGKTTEDLRNTTTTVQVTIGKTTTPLTTSREITTEFRSTTDVVRLVGTSAPYEEAATSPNSIGTTEPNEETSTVALGTTLEARVTNSEVKSTSNLPATTQKFSTVLGSTFSTNNVTQPDQTSAIPGNTALLTVTTGTSFNNNTVSTTPQATSSNTVLIASIAAGVAGAIILLILIAALVWWCKRQKRRDQGFHTKDELFNPVYQSGYPIFTTSDNSNQSASANHNENVNNPYEECGDVGVTNGDNQSDLGDLENSEVTDLDQDIYSGVTSSGGKKETVHFHKETVDNSLYGERQ